MLARPLAQIHTLRIRFPLSFGFPIHFSLSWLIPFGLLLSYVSDLVRVMVHAPDFVFRLPSRSMLGLIICHWLPRYTTEIDVQGPLVRPSVRIRLCHKQYLVSDLHQTTKSISHGIDICDKHSTRCVVWNLEPVAILLHNLNQPGSCRYILDRCSYPLKIIQGKSFTSCLMVAQPGIMHRLQGSCKTAWKRSLPALSHPDDAGMVLAIMGLNFLLKW
jgi:hypothetical protein